MCVHWGAYTDPRTPRAAAREDLIQTHRSAAASFHSLLCRALFSSSTRGERSALDGEGRKGENQNLRAVRFLADGMDGAGGTGADEQSMDSAMFPTESRGLWISCMEGERGGGRRRWE